MDFWLFLFLCFCSFTVRQYGLLTFKIHRVLVVVITAKIHRACAQYLADHADALLNHASRTLVDDAVIDHLIFDDDWRGKSAALYPNIQKNRRKFVNALVYLPCPTLSSWACFIFGLPLFVGDI